MLYVNFLLAFLLNANRSTLFTMTIHFATDHAGFALKEALVSFVRDELGYEVVDHGAHEFDAQDDYPEFIARAARAVSDAPETSRGIILGGSGQGEAIVANRFPQVRAVVWYGKVSAREADQGGQQSGDGMEIIHWAREHNNATILSLGARFLSVDDAKEAVRLFLSTPFSGDERHTRRIAAIEQIMRLASSG